MDFAQVFPIFNKLTAEEQQRVLSVCTLQRVRAGAVLHDGSPECMGLIFVRSGQLRAHMLSEEGREVTISRFFERDVCLFSASCVMPNMQFDIFITAEKDSEIYILPACLYKNLMDESLAVSNYSCDLISHHFSELIWLMEQIMWKKFDARLAKFLLDEQWVEGTDTLVITHDKIANHMGTAREVVTRMLRYFQSEGMVSLTRGTVRVTDEKALAAIAGEDH